MHSDDHFLRRRHGAGRRLRGNARPVAERGGVSSLRIKAGAGSLEVRGVSQSDTIVVKALVQVEDEREDRAREIIESDLVLSLERDGQGAQLDAYFDDHGWVFGSDGHGRVALEVIVPERM